MYANPSPRKWNVVGRMAVAAAMLGAAAAPARAQSIPDARSIVVLDVRADSVQDSAVWTEALRRAFAGSTKLVAITREERQADVAARLRTTHPRAAGEVMQQGVPVPRVALYATVEIRRSADSLAVTARAVDMETTRILARVETVVSRFAAPGEIADSLAARLIRAVTRRSIR